MKLEPTVYFAFLHTSGQPAPTPPLRFLTKFAMGQSSTLFPDLKQMGEALFIFRGLSESRSPPSLNHGRSTSAQPQPVQFLHFLTLLDLLSDFFTYQMVSMLRLRSGHKYFARKLSSKNGLGFPFQPQSPGRHFSNLLSQLMGKGIYLQHIS